MATPRAIPTRNDYSSGVSKERIFTNLNDFISFEKMSIPLRSVNGKKLYVYRPRLCVNEALIKLTRRNSTLLYRKKLTTFLQILYFYDGNYYLILFFILLLTIKHRNHRSFNLINPTFRVQLYFDKVAVAIKYLIVSDAIA